MTVAHVPTGYMLADVLTKPLAKIKFFDSSMPFWGSSESRTQAKFLIPSGIKAAMAYNMSGMAAIACSLKRMLLMDAIA